jgi:uncharacterized protein YggE
MKATTFVRSSGKLALLGAALLVGLAACAPQPVVNSGGVYLDNIAVTGSGEAIGAPDIARISLGVNITSTSIAMAMDESTAVMEAISDALVELGVAAEDIQTSNFSIWPEDRFERGIGESLTERSYRIENTVTVKVRDLGILAEVIEAALENGANNLYGLDFSVDDSSELAAEARALAVADAQSKAEQLAEELGVTLGEARLVSEQFGSVSVRSESARPMGGGGGPAISEGSISVSVQVNVTFDMVR